MTENLTSTKELAGTRVYKGKKIPHKIGKVHDFVFFPNEKRVAGFITKQRDLLLMIKRKGHFVSIKGYYLYEGIAIVRPEKGSTGTAAYKLLDLYPDDCVEWLGLPVVTEDERSVGVVSNVCFVDQSGEVKSIEVSPGALGKLTQGTRSIPTNLIKGYRQAGSTTLALEGQVSSAGTNYKTAIVVSNEALDIGVDNEKALVSKAGKMASAVANNAGVDTAAVSEKAKVAAKVTGNLVSSGAAATTKQLKKTKGMFSAFKDEYNKARHDD